MPIRADAEAAGCSSFASLLAAHLEDLRLQNYSLAAQEQAALVLPRLLLHLREEGLSDPRAVSEAHLTRFARRLAEQQPPLAPQTQASYLGAVKRFFAFLMRRRLILIDPACTLTLPRCQRLPRAVLSETQARRLMAAPFPCSVVGLRDRAILETLYGTGIRKGECLRLELVDLDLGQGRLFIRDGKGKRDRLVPVAGRAAAALDHYLRSARPELIRGPRQDALFLTRLGTRVSQSLLDLLVRKHARAAGIPRPVSPHVLRHTCATHLLQGGADVRHLQELLGHSSLQTTALYTRVNVADLRQVLARCHPRERAWARRQGR